MRKFRTHHAFDYSLFFVFIIIIIAIIVLRLFLIFLFFYFFLFFCLSFYHMKIGRVGRVRFDVIIWMKLRWIWSRIHLNVNKYRSDWHEWTRISRLFGWLIVIQKYRFFFSMNLVEMLPEPNKKCLVTRNKCKPFICWHCRCGSRHEMIAIGAETIQSTIDQWHYNEAPTLISTRYTYHCRCCYCCCSNCAFIFVSFHSTFFKCSLSKWPILKSNESNLIRSITNHYFS